MIFLFSFFFFLESNVCFERSEDHAPSFFVFMLSVIPKFTSQSSTTLIFIWSGPYSTECKEDFRSIYKLMGLDLILVIRLSKTCDSLRTTHPLRAKATFGSRGDRFWSDCPYNLSGDKSDIWQFSDQGGDDPSRRQYTSQLCLYRKTISVPRDETLRRYWNHLSNDVPRWRWAWVSLGLVQR